MYRMYVRNNREINKMFPDFKNRTRTNRCYPIADELCSGNFPETANGKIQTILVCASWQNHKAFECLATIHSDCHWNKPTTVTTTPTSFNKHWSAWWPWPLTFWPPNRFMSYSCDELPSCQFSTRLVETHARQLGPLTPVVETGFKYYY